MTKLIKALMIICLLVIVQSGLYASYISIIDSGSTGSRIYLFNIEYIDGKLKITSYDLGKASRVQPGISTYASAPDKVGTDHIAPLIKALKDFAS